MADDSFHVQLDLQSDLFDLSHISDGQGSFLYTVTSCVQPFSPFYPGSFGSQSQADDVLSISVATENGGLLNTLCSEFEKSFVAPTREDARAFFLQHFNRAFKAIEVGWLRIK